MKLKNFRTIKLSLISLTGFFIVLFAGLIYFTYNQQLNLASVVRFSFEIVGLVIALWVIYLVTEIDILHQGNIGKGLFYIILNFLIFSLRSLVVGLANLQIPIFTELGKVVSDPQVFSFLRMVNMVLILVGLIYIARVYRIKE